MIGLALLVAAWRSVGPGGRSTTSTGVERLGRAATGLLGNLSLFFVPAGVGVVQYLGLLEAQGPALAASLVVSTLLTLVATVGVFCPFKRLIGLRGET